MKEKLGTQDWYSTPQYLREVPDGNTQFIPEELPELKQKGLRIAPSIWGDFSRVEISPEIAFCAKEAGKIIQGQGLLHFIEWTFPNRKTQGVIFDNHNHALYFWCKYLIDTGIHIKIQPKIPLVHIDMHSDLWKNENTLSNLDMNDISSVANFVNTKCTVANYIDPAIRAGIIWEVIRIEGEQDLINKGDKLLQSPFFLNVDLDFFAEELEDISFNLKKRVIQFYLAQNPYVTIATSPFFIPGERAIEMFRKVFLED